MIFFTFIYVLFLKFMALLFFTCTANMEASLDQQIGGQAPKTPGSHILVALVPVMPRTILLTTARLFCVVCCYVATVMSCCCRCYAIVRS